MKPPTALTRSALARHPLPPIESGDKDSHGQVLIIAGSRDVPGAALLAAHGAMRSGAGKLQIAAPDAIAVALGVAMPEAMVVGHATHRDGGFAQSAIARLVELARRADAIIAGPGLESNSTAAPLGRELLKLGRPLAIDAALLRILPECEAEARGATILPILLPHAGEMASLLGCKPEEVAADPLAAGRDCARRYRAGPGQGRAKPCRRPRRRGLEVFGRRSWARRFGLGRYARGDRRRPARPRCRSARRAAVGGMAPRRSRARLVEARRPIGLPRARNRR